MRLSACFMEIIAYTAFVTRPDNAGQVSFEQAQNTMRQLISQSDAYLQKTQFALEDFQTAKFAVFAWVDEALLTSQWAGRHQWQHEQLQRRYFQTADAGELFFEKLNAIAPHQTDVREVYYLCLSLGFAGQYCNEGDHFMLEQLRSSNLKVLTGNAIDLPAWDQERLYPQAYPASGKDGTALLRKRLWSGFTVTCAASPIVLYGLLYVIYLFILGNIGANLIVTGP